MKFQMKICKNGVNGCSSTPLTDSLWLKGVIVALEILNKIFQLDTTDYFQTELHKVKLQVVEYTQDFKMKNLISVVFLYVCL